MLRDNADMCSDRSLKDNLAKVGSQYAGDSPPRFDQRYRRFLDLLRDRDWVVTVELPPAPRIKLRALQSDWIERRDISGVAHYRLTDAGAAELKKVRP